MQLLLQFGSVAVALLTVARTQSTQAPLERQCNDFNSSYQLSASQIAAAGIDDTTAANVEVTLNFQRSDWAGGSVDELEFYRVPANASNATAGSLLKLEVSTNASLYALPPETAISRIMYQSETLNGSKVPVSAYILWPYLPRRMPDGYPVVAWAHPTTGNFPECGPSHVRDLWYHWIAPHTLVQQGYVVVATDYQGLGVGKDAKGKPILHPYFSNPSQANDVIYAVQAAQAAFKSLSERFVVVGHSQGGGVAWGAAQRQARKPVRGYLGAVAGSPLTNIIRQIDEASSIAFLAALLTTGFQSVYPDFDIGSILTAEGIQRYNLAAELQGCDSVLSTLLSSTDLYQPDWQHLPRVEAYQNLTGNGGRNFAGPLLVVQGVADPIVPVTVTDEAVNDTCKLFPDHSLEYQRYDGAGHIPAMYVAQRKWLDWIEDRFEGRVAVKGCQTKQHESAMPITQQGEITWFVEYAVQPYETF